MKFSLEGRSAAFEKGKENLPGGEVYYAPQETSAEGVITIHFGKQIKGIQLEFRQGRVVSATAGWMESWRRRMTFGYSWRYLAVSFCFIL